nr:Chain P, PEPTIDE [synthetic construct]4D0T_Z Chain Z, PEPTIDE [synthetic construct]
DSTTPAPT